MGARQTPRPLSVSDYCRRARRLRHALRDRPNLLHRSLRQLSDQFDGQLRRPEPLADRCSGRCTVGRAIPASRESRSSAGRLRCGSPGGSPSPLPGTDLRIAITAEHSPLAAIPVSVWRSPAQCEAFSRHVAAMLDGPILRHSSRQILLREAARRGIGRFEANLVIAAVQHRAKQTPPAPLRQPCARPSRRWLPAVAFVLFATVQSAIVLAVWHLFLS